MDEFSYIQGGVVIDRVWANSHFEACLYFHERLGVIVLPHHIKRAGEPCVH